MQKAIEKYMAWTKKPFTRASQRLAADTGRVIRSQNGRARTIDAVRRDRTFGDKADALVAELTRSATAAPADSDIEERLRDDELRMIFMCCHPEIPRDASVALSLKTIGGFSVREIARAFLCEE